MFAAVLLSLSASLCLAGPDDPVIFNDANLKAAVETVIDVADPTEDDMLGLTWLYAEHSGIAYLTGLEYATNLTELRLYNNNISDISPLANLASLTKLSLFYNNISDVSPLENLTSFTELYLQHNNISDISPLVNLIDLTSLYLSNNNIIDISPLANLTSLSSLSLADNNISDISPLVNMTGLTTLYLDNNNISDISPLANLTGLTKLWLSYNNISDISPLVNLTDLEWLHLSYNNISDISPLVNLTDLVYLNVQSNLLNVDAYLFWLPVIEENNPRLEIFFYDPYTGGPAVALISPNGGETLLGGREQLIQWGSIDISTVDISYSINGGVMWMQIAQVPSEDGPHSFSWITPQINSDQCLIRFTELNNPSISDQSEAVFSIVPCNMSLYDGDLNNDCRIDLADFSVLTGNWLADGL